MTWLSLLFPALTCYFFAPDFSEFDYYEMEFAPGATPVQVLPEFEWPSGAGSAFGIWWYAAMTDAGITELYGTLGMFQFGWHD